MQNELPQPERCRLNAPSQPRTPETIEPGITYTHALMFGDSDSPGRGLWWRARTPGVRWTHNALKASLPRLGRAETPTTIITGMTPFMTASAIPAGTIRLSLAMTLVTATHTIGTMIGDDGAGNQIGMAPGAKWIGCRNMDEGVGTPARYIECMEFFLAPTRIGGGRAKATRPRRRTSQTTPGTVRLRRVVRLTHCKLLWKHKLLLVS